MVYWCKASKELSDDEMRYVAKNLHCTVDYIAKVLDEERWDYYIHKESLTKHERDILKNAGLEILVDNETMDRCHQVRLDIEEKLRRSNTSSRPSARGR